ncbi:hypothetical protein AC477_00105 [miscellaneous Crenarchaeota group-1 archaeon SG8-32-1]|uniref:Uncharacterized protein n=1 Tax=miscellaneous Crenarchaeota group-1 archaeon SG8-32-1 TaxID=1685124 RepID=A0A0M0C1I3_9ARCH|nr:MAG: hypothetical protein AC477_00105 [miscellaneous Crenarchaeota group-1 archaeon SG8-32-1]
MAEIDKIVICAYCQVEHARTSEAIVEHVTSCTKRPEFALSAKLGLMEEAGDKLLEVIRQLCTTVTQVEGMRTKVWVIFRECEEGWESVKNITIDEIMEIMEAENEDREYTEHSE